MHVNKLARRVIDILMPEVGGSLIRMEHHFDGLAHVPLARVGEQSRRDALRSSAENIATTSSEQQLSHFSLNEDPPRSWKSVVLGQHSMKCHLVNEMAGCAIVRAINVLKTRGNDAPSVRIYGSGIAVSPTFLVDDVSHMELEVKTIPCGSSLVFSKEWDVNNPAPHDNTIDSANCWRITRKFQCTFNRIDEEHKTCVGEGEVRMQCQQSRYSVFLVSNSITGVSAWQLSSDSDVVCL